MSANSSSWRAASRRGRVLLLDEVLSGLNNTEIDEALTLIRDIRDRGTTIIFVEHLMRAVVALSDRVAVLNDGALIALGRRKKRCATAKSSTSISVKPMLLEIENLAVGYGGAPAILDIALTVGEHEIVSVIGPNGAGKSTLINSIAGLLRRSAAPCVLPASISALAPHQVCRQGFALVPEGRRLFPGMSVEENLDIGCYRPEARRPRAQLRARLCAFPGPGRAPPATRRHAFGRQQQMVAIARALMAEPHLLLLDEPSLGLAPSIVGDMFRIIERSTRKAWRSFSSSRTWPGDGDRRPRLCAGGRPHRRHRHAGGADAQSRIQEAYLGL